MLYQIIKAIPPSRVRQLRRALLGICLFGMPVTGKATAYSIYGAAPIDNPKVVMLLKHQAFKRLQGIDVGGPARYYRGLAGYSLYDHAVAMYAILKQKGRPERETLAALLNPIAHSVFSFHGTTYLKDRRTDLPYYLAFQERFVDRMALPADNSQVYDSALKPVQEAYKVIDTAPPTLSLTTFELTLRLAYNYRLITRPEIQDLMDHVVLEADGWVFTEQESAEKFGRLSLYFAEHYWGSLENFLIGYWFKTALLRGISLGIMTAEEARYSQDRKILVKLENSNDPVIKMMLQRCRNPGDYFQANGKPSDSSDMVIRVKFYGIDPVVKRSGEGSKRLTELDADFSKDFKDLKDFLSDEGRGVRLFDRPKGQREASAHLPKL